MDASAPTTTVMSAESHSQMSKIIADVGARLGRFVRARVGNDADAEDILQDVWHRLVSALEAGNIEQIGAWLYAVARNRIIDRARQPRTESLDASEVADDDADSFVIPESVLRDDRTPATEHRRAVFWDTLHAALAELPPEQRQVFIWHAIEGYSFQEIAELTGENQNTLLARKRYAVLHLRERLAGLRDHFQS